MRRWSDYLAMLQELVSTLRSAGVESVFRENQPDTAHLRLADEPEIGNDLESPTNNDHDQRASDPEHP